MSNKNRAALAQKIAALASQDRDLFMSMWDALAQYVENGEGYLDSFDPNFGEAPEAEEVNKVAAAEEARNAFDAAIVSLAA